ncbi:hypothetical protein ACFX58_14825 [Sphingomonas sp. NCPPB 2930]
MIISEVEPGDLAGGAAVETVNSMKRGVASVTPTEATPGAFGAPRQRRH